MRTTTMRRTITALTLAAAAVALTGCAQIHQQIGDAWAVTYEVRVDDPDSVALHDVSYLGAQQRGDAATTQRLRTASTKPAPQDGTSSWEHETIVLAEDDADLRATPPAGDTASCRVLLDGERVIAEQTGEPGREVRCTVTTPAFG